MQFSGEEFIRNTKNTNLKTPKTLLHNFMGFLLEFWEKKVRRDVCKVRGISEGAFIVCCNAAALPMYRLLIYRSSTQRTAPQVHFLAVPQCSSRRRDGNTTTATYRNAAAVDYERVLSSPLLEPYLT